MLKYIEEKHVDVSEKQLVEVYNFLKNESKRSLQVVDNHIIDDSLSKLISLTKDKVKLKYDTN